MRRDRRRRGTRQDSGDLQRTFSVTDPVGRHGPPNVDYATAVGHLVFVGVLTSVVIIQRVHNPQIQQELI